MKETVMKFKTVRFV